MQKVDSSIYDIFFGLPPNREYDVILLLVIAARKTSESLGKQSTIRLQFYSSDSRLC
jgi:hypothetical protein